jgi:16S rRNA (guanine966-N2)-methyltransferase
VRIIGGTFRGRTLAYSGDIRTRPMKDRVREAMFNLLAERVRGKHAIDLFAGTGALAFEALSRGAAHATLIERHLPTAKIIEQNATVLGVSNRVEVCFSDTFIWGKRFAGSAEPLVVFAALPRVLPFARATCCCCCQNCGASPAGAFAVEADERFDALLPRPELWFVRAYPPAVVGIGEKP